MASHGGMGERPKGRDWLQISVLKRSEDGVNVLRGTLVGSHLFAAGVWIVEETLSHDLVILPSLVSEFIQEQVLAIL